MIAGAALKVIMEKMLIAAVLVCHPGDRLVDWGSRVPADVQLADLLVTVEPFYTRLSIYQPDHPEAVRRCCNGKQASVVHIPVKDGKLCVGQSQPQMKWTLRLTLTPGVAI